MIKNISNSNIALIILVAFFLSCESLKKTRFNVWDYISKSDSKMSLRFDRNDSLAIIDTELLIKRAKMFTMLRYGANNSIEDIFNQKDSTFSFKQLPFILFIKIRHGQNITRTSKFGYSTSFIGSGCNYIIAYSRYFDKYYRFDGFENDDYENFFMDMLKYSEHYNLEEYDIFKFLSISNSHVNFQCYYDRYVLKKMSKNGCSCNCGEAFDFVR